MARLWGAVDNRQIGGAMGFQKLTSGKFLLTVAGAVVFVYVSCTGKIEEQAITAILTAIFINYFQKRNGNGNNGQSN